MQIVQQNQYNQGISKYKLLSNNAGVGSIVTTKIGSYVLISDIMRWKFIRKTNEMIERERKKTSDNQLLIKYIDIELKEKIGLSRIEDQRFIEFLQTEQNLPNLICLTGIPQLSLNENYNSINKSSNPILTNLNLNADEFAIPATHFPKWFIGHDGTLQEYKEWLKLWNAKGLHSREFAPPRDANKPIFKNGKQVQRKVQDADNNAEKGIDRWIDLYQELTQTNTILICPNGHLSDIPWSKYIKWKITGAKEDAKDLFTLEDCCSNPKLKWTESTTKSEGYASIFIECKSCHLKVNLEGINGIKPKCCGHKPWLIDHSDPNASIPFGSCSGVNNQPEQMYFTLVTGNNVYYANTFSSLYVPSELYEAINPILKEALKIAKTKFDKLIAKKPDTKKEDWANKNLTEEFLIDNDFEHTHDFIPNLQKLFLQEKESEENIDTYETYRYKEYTSFRDYKEYKNEDLTFKDIILDSKLEIAQYFNKIQKVENLRVANTLLSFTRKEPKERIVIKNEVIQRTAGQKIYNIDDDKLFVLPVNIVYGEGIFFDFKDTKIDTWVKEITNISKQRLNEILMITDIRKQGAALREEIRINKAKQFLIHTFAHLIMRELEFMCGYPTASLKERLYISPRMSGMLIYTAEGAEGSMGGLASQAYPSKINDLIKSALHRAEQCSSDPLCWESDGQGIFNQNLASCFSCSLVAETACEAFNLSLDRRFLIDSEFGFFRDLFL